MFKHMFLFEWRYFTRQPSFIITSLIFFSLAFATSFDQIGMTGWGMLNKNSPYLISQLLLFCGMFSLFLVVNFIADTALRDHTSEMAEILYCKPLNPTRYQLGRFCGSFAVILTVFSAMPLGMLLGSLMPWASEARFGPFNLANYLSPFLWLSVPTLFVFCCFCYALAIRFKSTMPIYLAVVAVIVLNEISESLFDALANQNIAALLDPFGWRAFNQLTQYWTTSERNIQLLPLEGVLLQNRLIWLTVGVVVMTVFGGFSRSLSLRQLKSKKTKPIKTETVKDEATISQNAGAIHPIQSSGKDNANWQQFIARTRFEIKQVIFDPGFYILVGCTLLLLLAVVAQPKGMFGTSYWPVTQSMVEQIQNAMNILSIIVITYYTAEVVWRERASGMGDIIDSMPVAGLTFWLSKLVAVWLVLVLLLCSAMLVTILFQSGQDYQAFEFNQYFISLFYFTALPWMMKAVLAFLLS
ncbi:MAG: ABC-2 type transport system permease protein, partial [Phenylobacterium sp.]